MFKKLIASIAMSFSAFTAQAEFVTMVDFYLDGSGWSPATGGVGSIHYREIVDGDNRGVSFEVNVAPFADSLDNPVTFNTDHGTPDWLTPVAGSGYEFDPVDLYGVWAENAIFGNTLGWGVATWVGGKIYKINFPDGYASWTVTKTDAQVSSVPEPGSLILLSLGLLGMATQMRRNSPAPAPVSGN